MSSPLLCPLCHEPLLVASVLSCSTCGRRYPVDDSIADFAEGDYYDHFDADTVIAAEHAAGLALEEKGTRARITDFYLPLIARSASPKSPVILDLGCGNGAAVDVLADAGIEAWGLDLSALRKWQWRVRRHRERLVVGSALRTPFPDGHFDVVISSGVLEHIGVRETGGERYSVTPLPERDALREVFCREVLRITRPGGTIFLDFPNGSFPIDFWHSDATGGARWHRSDEGFLPTFAEVKRYFGAVDDSVVLRPLSPHGRLQCQQVRRHWYGRLLWLPAQAWLALMAVPPLRFLAATPLNPFLVIEAQKPL